MKVVLEINGRKKTFSNVESISILEEKTYDSVETASKPIEGKWFEVNPETIKRNLFKGKRKDQDQEMTRQIIKVAFRMEKKNPEKYDRPFKTLIPEKTWVSKTGEELAELANELGDGMVDWVQQALEWAQRISNGESWKSICNDPDTANWFRAIILDGDSLKIVGGSQRHNINYSPTSLLDSIYLSSDGIYNNTVPLVVLYK